MSCRKPRHVGTVDVVNEASGPEHVPADAALAQCAVTSDFSDDAYLQIVRLLLVSTRQAYTRSLFRSHADANDSRLRSSENVPVAAPAIALDCLGLLYTGESTIPPCQLRDVDAGPRRLTLVIEPINHLIPFAALASSVLASK
jgi:hypothetical protein